MSDHFADRERAVGPARPCAPRLMRRSVEIAIESSGEPHRSSLDRSTSLLAGAYPPRARCARPGAPRPPARSKAAP